MTLNDLLKMQNTLDDIILDRLLTREKVIVPEKELLMSRLLALFTEVGEFSNELSVHRYWKRSHVRDDKKTLEEFVDCLFFLLSIANLLGYSAQDIDEAYMAKWKTNLERQKNNY